MSSLAVFESKSADVVIGGVRLRVEGPRMHQHRALVDLMRGLRFQPILDVIKPALDAAQSGGAFVSTLFAELPKVGAVLTDVVGIDGVSTVFEAAVVCLDTKVNRNRVIRASKAPGDDDDLPDGLADAEPATGPNGEYLRCDEFRSWLHDTLTMGQAWTVVTASISLGGYSEMGKAMLAQVAGAMRALPAQTSTPTQAPATVAATPATTDG